MTPREPVGDIEWLDEQPDGPSPREDELHLEPRGLRSRRTRIALGVAAVILVGGGLVVAGRSAEPGDAGPTSTTTVPPSFGSTRADTFENFPVGPPRAALAAIRERFPRADVIGFVVAPARGAPTRPDLTYEIRWRNRTISIEVRPVRPGDVDTVFRTDRGLELAQQLENSWIAITLRVATGSTTQRDFAAMQGLVLDTRLLASR